MVVLLLLFSHLSKEIIIVIIIDVDVVIIFIVFIISIGLLR